MERSTAIIFALIVGFSRAAEHVSAQGRDPARSDLGRCKVETGWPGNVNIHAAIDKERPGGPQYTFKYECMYVPGVSRYRRCGNGGRPFPYEPGRLDPPTKEHPFDYMDKCDQASVVCCKPRP